MSRYQASFLLRSGTVHVAGAGTAPCTVRRKGQDPGVVGVASPGPAATHTHRRPMTDITNKTPIRSVR